jgi:hypothetical protein
MGALLAAVRTEDAARPFPGTQQGPATFTLIKKEAGVPRHDFFFPVAAIRAGNNGC